MAQDPDGAAVHEALDAMDGCSLEQVLGSPDVNLTVASFAVRSFAVGSGEMINDANPFGRSRHRSRIFDICLEDLYAAWEGGCLACRSHNYADGKSSLDQSSNEMTTGEAS
jgi:hypothetical protein